MKIEIKRNGDMNWLTVSEGIYPALSAYAKGGEIKSAWATSWLRKDIPLQHMVDPSVLSEVLDFGFGNSDGAE